MLKQEPLTQDVVDVSVLFITYNRSDLLEIAFRSIRERMDFGNLRVEFVVSDDASDPENLSRVQSLPFDKHLLSETNKGLGANTNKGIVVTKGSYILQIQDDFEFVGARTLIFTALQIMQADRDVGIVQLTNETPGVPHEARCLDDGTRYLVFENDGIPQLRDCSARPYSDRPHLKRRQFCEDIGPYRERVPMTDMELAYQRRVACQKRWRVATIVQATAFSNLGVERSFNPGYVRARRLERIEGYPLVGTVFRRLRPTMKRVRDWVRDLRL
ncbi:glycosyltransferase family A protein [Sulfuriflexus mobilis]|uniref:glycosyltransferase family A protein n=1 Tax=Sulfuriflexus mobilis TaxID=1811807 RepID=UPI000F81FC3D|nr:glycosyltransferase family A protein [Sulfuriflexus mobilis]